MNENEVTRTTEYDIQKIRDFAKKSFGNTAGNACKNVKELTERLIENE